MAQQSLSGSSDNGAFDLKRFRKLKGNRDYKVSIPGVVNSVAVGVIEVGRTDGPDGGVAEIIEQHEQYWHIKAPTAVANAPRAESKPPSPTRQTTLRSGAPSFAPMAAPGEKPMVAIPPEVIKDAGWSDLSCCPAPFLATHVCNDNGILRKLFHELLEQTGGMDWRVTVVLACGELILPGL